MRSRRRLALAAALSASIALAAGSVAAQGLGPILDGEVTRGLVDRNLKGDPKVAQRARRGERAGAAEETPLLPKEAVEADVSTRTIRVTTAFAGTEIVVFGSVVNSRQPSAEAGYYDVIVVLEGMATPLVARRKSNVAGLWVNTRSVSFESAPSYYAIASTRPIEEIAEDNLLHRHGIGLEFARLAPAARSVIETDAGELRDYREAVIRLKQKEGLYIKADYSVIFIGQSLFRSAIALPANVPVGPLTARVYLFREGELLSTFQSRVRLEREGVELWLYRFAMLHPALYGVFAVMLAVIAGLVAAMPFRRRGGG